ncbi:hypothetical protein MCOR27_007535 [Pyricularia oryzae]|uniref:NAD-dependent epimerase/dehydratase domain-containing protein n=2 Tax=Pyricularia TaxID=48558 RepID=A0ABQ8NVE8_PYRGI|nr:hypothetical protein MCOR01_004431 [Pyricularia oryzae]KAI6302699.1 hypothetical protein MCOR33_001969 [Pyricularia grisea]KAH9431111.1 hypothetical protein MCOR02_008419 [Pyricularia oryzae]KAI6256813.1 hypothetical protein MCOR19_006757 [Pyricularia oryzae]KAI6274104.1 hypothetical protein MCOR27_007535 [Pyricularia oryzae]
MAIAQEQELVLITGATGHVGSTTLAHLIRAGYNVRAVVRSEAKSAQLLARPSIQRAIKHSRRWSNRYRNQLTTTTSTGQLSFVIVPDITAPGAYDDAVVGATLVVHIASPLVTADTVPLSKHEEYFLRPAVRGTLGLLEAARAAGTVRRVVITSSIVSLVPVDRMEGNLSPEEARSLPPVQPTDRVRDADGPYTSEFAAYHGSKVASLAHAEEWVARECPGFDVVYLHPSFVLGHNDAATTPAQALKGTNAVVLAMLLGQRFGPYAGATVHVEDVARAHVAALAVDRVPGNQSYILSGPRPTTWNDAKEIVERRFPEAIKSRMLVTRGSVDTTYLPFDVSLTEETFGFEFTSFEEQVVSTVGQFIELRMQQKAALSRKNAAVRARDALPSVRANA